MRTAAISLALLVGSLTGFPAHGNQGSISVGDPASKVREALGEPHGFAKIGGKELLYYERGRVVIEKGEVSQVRLLSEEEHAERQEARQERQDRRQTEQKETLELQITQAKKRLAEAQAQAAEVKAAAAQRTIRPSAYRRCAPKVTVTPPILPNVVGRYREAIRSHRLRQSFLKPRYELRFRTEHHHHLHRHHHRRFSRF